MKMQRFLVANWYQMYFHKYTAEELATLFYLCPTHETYRVDFQLDKRHNFRVEYCNGQLDAVIAPDLESIVPLISENDYQDIFYPLSVILQTFPAKGTTIGTYGWIVNSDNCARGASDPGFSAAAASLLEALKRRTRDRYEDYVHCTKMTRTRLQDEAAGVSSMAARQQRLTTNKGRTA